MHLSLVIPAYREAATVAGTVERVRAELGPLVAGGLEVVVVDDGSGDGTASAARAVDADIVIELAQNRGKGAAVRAGMLAASGAVRAFTDADLSYAPAQVARLAAAVEEGWDVVVGNRYHEGSTTLVEASTVRQVGGRAINLATRAVLHDAHPDTQCGLKALRGDVAEVLFRHARVDGFAVADVPVEVANSDRSTVHVVRDALRLLVDLGRIRRAGASGAYDLTDGEAGAVRLGAPEAGE